MSQPEDVPLQRARYRVYAVQETQRSVRSIIQKSVTDPKPLCETDELGVQLCIAIERCLLVGIKVSFSDTIFRNEPSFMEFLTACADSSKDAGFQQDCKMVRSIDNLNTAAQGRAWVRHALNELRLSDYIRVCLRDRQLLASWYEPFALVRDVEGAELFVSVLDALSTVAFKLRLADSSLTNPEYSWEINKVGLPMRKELIARPARTSSILAIARGQIDFAAVNEPTNAHTEVTSSASASSASSPSAPAPPSVDVAPVSEVVPVIRKTKSSRTSRKPSAGVSSSTSSSSSSSAKVLRAQRSKRTRKAKPRAREIDSLHSDENSGNAYQQTGNGRGAGAGAGAVGMTSPSQLSSTISTDSVVSGAHSPFHEASSSPTDATKDHTQANNQLTHINGSINTDFNIDNNRQDHGVSNNHHASTSTLPSDQNNTNGLPYSNNNDNSNDHDELSTNHKSQAHYHLPISHNDSQDHHDSPISTQHNHQPNNHHPISEQIDAPKTSDRPLAQEANPRTDRRRLQLSMQISSPQSFHSMYSGDHDSQSSTSQKRDGDMDAARFSLDSDLAQRQGEGESPAVTPDTDLLVSPAAPANRAVAYSVDMLSSFAVGSNQAHDSQEQQSAFQSSPSLSQLNLNDSHTSSHNRGLAAPQTSHLVGSPTGIVPTTQSVVMDPEIESNDDSDSDDASNSQRPTSAARVKRASVDTDEEAADWNQIDAILEATEQEEATTSTVEAPIQRSQPTTSTPLSQSLKQPHHSLVTPSPPALISSVSPSAMASTGPNRPSSMSDAVRTFPPALVPSASLGGGLGVVRSSSLSMRLEASRASSQSVTSYTPSNSSGRGSVTSYTPSGSVTDSQFGPEVHDNRGDTYSISRTSTFHSETKSPTNHDTSLFCKPATPTTVAKATTPSSAVRHQRGLSIKMIVSPPQNRVANNALFAKQKGLCATCSLPLETGLFAKVRYCRYTEQLYCRKCHVKDMRVIPSRLLFNLDTKPHAVCRLAASYLDAMSNVPSLSISQINVGLYQKSPKLARVRQLRLVLRHLSAFVMTCKQKDALLKLFGPRVYLLSDADEEKGGDMYSLKDIVEILDGDLAERISRSTAALITHVTDGQCQICASKGFICEFCRSSTLIYSFQTSLVTQCASCHAFFHSRCYKREACPKCARMRKRKP